MLDKKRLAELRNKAGYSQEEFSTIIGIPTVTYQRYESGKNEPKIGVAALIAQKLNTTVAYLIGETNEPKRVVLVAELSGSRKAAIEGMRQAGVDPEAFKKALAFLSGTTDE